jgi:hypothetical protein
MHLQKDKKREEESENTKMISLRGGGLYRKIPALAELELIYTTISLPCHSLCGASWVESSNLFMITDMHA